MFGVYGIDYDDDEKDTCVAAELIRSKESCSPLKQKSNDASDGERESAARKFKEKEKHLVLPTKLRMGAMSSTSTA